MDKKTLGLKLRELRNASGLKWNEILSLLNNKYGISTARSTIYGYENGRNFPDPDMLLALCDMYGCSDPLVEFGVSQHTSTPSSENIEEIILIENNYSPQNWETIKNFIALVPTVKMK